MPGWPSCGLRAPNGTSRAIDRGERQLAEREGLVGKLCLPYSLRGLLRWREGGSGRPPSVPPRPRAGRAGWLVRDRLPGAVRPLAGAPRPGDLRGRGRALDHAIEVCERAGLFAQSIQATRRATWSCRSRTGPPPPARRPRGVELAERLHYPVGRAAALEARGVSDEDPAAGAELLPRPRRPGARWRAPRGHPRRLLAGQLLIGTDDERAQELLEQAAAQSDELGRAPPRREGTGRGGGRRAPAAGLSRATRGTG